MRREAALGRAWPPRTPSVASQGPELPCGDTAALRGTHIWEDRWSGRRDCWLQCRPCHILAPRPWGFLGDLSGAPVPPVKWEGDPNDGGCLSQAKVHLDWTVWGVGRWGSVSSAATQDRGCGKRDQALGARKVPGVLPASILTVAPTTGAA